MKETNFVSSASCGDPMIRFTLMQVLELEKELEVKRKKLEMIKQKRLTLKSEVRFLRRRYEHLKQDQTLETSPKMLRLSESGGSEVPRKPSGENKKHPGVRAPVPCFDLKQKNTICNEKEALAKNASCDLEKKRRRSRGNDVLTIPVSLPDLNGEGNSSVTDKVPGFDLNQISVIDIRGVSFLPLSDCKVQCSGAKPSANTSVPEKLLRLIPKECGWKGWGEISYGGHGSIQRAKASEFLVRSWMEETIPGVNHCILSYVVGLDSLKATSNGTESWQSCGDIRLRMDGLFKLKEHAVQLTKEFTALYTNGPAGGGGIRDVQHLIVDKFENVTVLISDYAD